MEAYQGIDVEVATTALITLFSCCGGPIPGNESGLAALRLLLLLLGAGAALLGQALLVGAAGVTVGAAVSLVRAADGLESK